jgi:hypothetical protein
MGRKLAKLFRAAKYQAFDVLANWTLRRYPKVGRFFGFFLAKDWLFQNPQQAIATAATKFLCFSISAYWLVFGGPPKHFMCHRAPMHRSVA